MSSVIAQLRSDLPSVRMMKDLVLLVACPDHEVYVPIYWYGSYWACSTCAKRFRPSEEWDLSNRYHIEEEDRRYTANGWLARWWNLDESEVNIQWEI